MNRKKFFQMMVWFHCSWHKIFAYFIMKTYYDEKTSIT